MSDPFAGATADWMSLDSYETTAKTKAPDQAGAAAPTKDPQPSPPPSPEATAKPNIQVPTIEPPKETVARTPQNYPVMPSGVLERPAPATAVAEDPAALSEKREWVDVKQRDEENNKEAEAKRVLLERTQSPAVEHKDVLGVRFSALPSAKVQPVPAERISKSKLDREAAARAAMQGGKPAQDAPASSAVTKTANGTPVETKAGQQVTSGEAKSQARTKEEVAACEAFADFRRRQLEAIESDRRTLAELKAALNELGLVKKLDFMAGAEGPLIQSTAANEAEKGAAPATKQP